MIYSSTKHVYGEMIVCLQEADSLDSAEISSTLFDEMCLHQASLVHYNGDEPDESIAAILTDIKANMCPQQCSSKGNCENGICICTSGWYQFY